MLGALAKVYRATGRLLARPPRALTNKPQPVADTVQFALADPSYLQGVCVHLWPVVPAVAAINETHAAAAAPDLGE